MKTEDFAHIVEAALAEDLGGVGDITSMAVIPPEAMSVAEIVARQPGVVAGVDVADYVFQSVDPQVAFTAIEDGSAVTSGAVIGTVEGPSRSILTAERTALNLLARMSGVATATAAFVSAVEGTGARIMDTRKTMPGLRVLDKYAVTAGGGVNHRMGLYDAVMIKDNHIVAAGDIRKAVKAARLAVGSKEVVVEVETLGQLAEVLDTDTDRVLLDNMDVDTLTKAVAMCEGRMPTEASGGVMLHTVAAIASTGIDFISIGSITHSAPQLDIALDFISG